MKNFIFCAMASVGVLNWVSKFHVSTDSEHKFHKTEIEIGYPLDPVWDRLDYPSVKTTKLCSKILKALFAHP